MYQDRVKRYVLQEFRSGYKNNISKENIVKGLKEIGGTKEEQEQLFKDCMVTIFLDEMFDGNEKNRERAIRLANRYLTKNNTAGNLVKEKLVKFYKKTGNLKQGKSVTEELLREEPENKWTISKYIIFLRKEGKDEEALQFINERRKIVKGSPVILNLEYRILLKKRELVGCVELLKNNVSILEIDGNTIEQRKRLIKELYIYREQLLNFAKERLIGCEINSTIDRINKRIAKERKKIANEKKQKNKENMGNIDFETVKKINKLIYFKRQIMTKEKIECDLDSIDNQVVKKVTKWQIEHAYGESSLEIAKEVRKDLKENENMTETETKMMKVIQNFLTSKSAKFYNHDNWVRIQETYFHKILNKKLPQKEENEKERSDED